MIDVVRHALRAGALDGDQVLLIQPTQPLREPKHIAQALALLTPDVDSVVSVVEIPRIYHQKFQYDITRDGWLINNSGEPPPANRQDVQPPYVRDGTVYAFHRRTVEQHGNIYGLKVRPLIIPPEETCPLDTPADWAEAERRLT